MAANIFIRSWIAAAFPMFARAMYRNLGVSWATSLLGFLCVAFAPVSVLLYLFGRSIRSTSRYALD